MTFLVPGIREQHQYLIEAAGGQLLANHFHRIVVADPYVVQTQALDIQQHPSYSGPMHFDPQKVDLRSLTRHVDEIRAVAEPYLDDAGRLAREQGIQVARRRGVFQAESRPQGLHGALLTIRHASGAQHEGAHAARMSLRSHRAKEGVCTISCAAGSAAQFGAGAQEQGTLDGPMAGVDSCQHRNRQALGEALEHRRTEIAAIGFGATEEGAEQDGLELRSTPA